MKMRTLAGSFRFFFFSVVNFLHWLRHMYGVVGYVCYVSVATGPILSSLLETG